jgi:hypothetical protein
MSRDNSSTSRCASVPAAERTRVCHFKLPTGSGSRGPALQASTVGAAFLTKTIPELNVKFEIWWASCWGLRGVRGSTMRHAPFTLPLTTAGAQGHRGARALPQLGPHVLQVSTRREPARCSGACRGRTRSLHCKNGPRWTCPGVQRVIPDLCVTLQGCRCRHHCV